MKTETMDSKAELKGEYQNLNSQKDRELRMITLLEQCVDLLTRIARNTTPAYRQAERIELSAQPIPGKIGEQA